MRSLSIKFVLSGVRVSPYVAFIHMPPKAMAQEFIVKAGNAEDNALQDIVLEAILW